MEKIPVMGIIGENEVKNGLISIRTYLEGDRGPFNVEEVIRRIRRANELRSMHF